MNLKIFPVCASLLLVISTSLVAQSNFIEGTITLNDGSSLTGEIDFQDWSSNPKVILFKNSFSGEVKDYSPLDLESFEAENAKYVSFRVTIDQTPFRVYTLDLVSQTSIAEAVFLKVLVKGGISLYQYSGVRENYYIEYQNEITELISHQYIVTRGSSFYIARDNEYLFRTQLKDLQMNCSDSTIDNLAYRQADLQEFVISCNTINSFDINYISKKSRTRVKNQFFSGMGISSYNQDYYVSRYFALGYGNPSFFEKSDVSFDMATSFIVGYGIQFEFPKNLRKRSFGISISYSQYEYTSKENLLNVIYRLPDEPEISEQQIISSPKLKLQVLDLKFWYAQRIHTGFPTLFFDGGIGFKNIFNYEATASYRITRYRSEDINAFGFSGSDPINMFESSREFDVSKARILSGIFLGFGYETQRFFSVSKIEYHFGTSSDDQRAFKNIQYQQRALSLVFGIKL